MDAKTRRDRIEQRVRVEREVGYAELAAEFDVSEMTIRRDVEALETLGVVRRVVGGAIALKGKDTEPSFATRVADAAEEKRHIADAVADLIGPSETLILDSGSTALAVARSLKGRQLGLTVVTPSVLAALELIDEPDTTVVLTGGELRPGELSLIGPAAEDTLANYNCDTFVMGVAGIDGDRGISDYHQAESRVKRAASKRADRVIVAADKSKLGRVTFVQHRRACGDPHDRHRRRRRTIPHWSPRAAPASRSSALPVTATAASDSRIEVRFAMTQHTIGIDIGTTGTKTVLFDTDQRHRRPGLARDGAALAGTGLRRGRHRPVARRTSSNPSGRCCSTSGIRREAVGAVAVSGMVPAVVPLDDRGNPLRRAILQNDARAHREVAELAAALDGVDLVAMTGSALTQQSVAPTMVWLRDARARRVRTGPRTTSAPTTGC